MGGSRGPKLTFESDLSQSENEFFHKAPAARVAESSPCVESNGVLRALVENVTAAS
jgi:hypothetical protein